MKRYKIYKTEQYPQYPGLFLWILAAHNWNQNSIVRIIYLKPTEKGNSAVKISVKRYACLQVLSTYRFFSCFWCLIFSGISSCSSIPTFVLLIKVVHSSSWKASFRFITHLITHIDIMCWGNHNDLAWFSQIMPDLVFLNVFSCLCYICLSESPKGLKFEPLNHQKQTLGGSRYIVDMFVAPKFLNITKASLLEPPQA